jgi:outer membrane protein OmpA-like peptidoglycan-associated protein
MNSMPELFGRPRRVMRRRMLTLGLAIIAGIAALLPAHATSIIPMSLVLFEGDDATLNESQKAQIDQVIEDEAFRGKKLIIIGHYDRTGAAEHRIEMSRRLAEAVSDYLIAIGVPPDTLVVSWHGDTYVAKRCVTIEPR